MTECGKNAIRPRLVSGGLFLRRYASFTACEAACLYLRGLTGETYDATCFRLNRRA